MALQLKLRLSTKCTLHNFRTMFHDRAYGMESDERCISTSMSCQHIGDMYVAHGHRQGRSWISSSLSCHSLVASEYCLGYRLMLSNIISLTASTVLFTPCLLFASLLQCHSCFCIMTTPHLQAALPCHELSQGHKQTSFPMLRSP